MAQGKNQTHNESETAASADKKFQQIFAWIVGIALVAIVLAALLGVF